MSEPVWILKPALLALHSRSLALHGGAEGLRDEGLLESALQRPINRYHYEGVEDVAELAATYAVAVSSNHAFVDGNKRAAFASMLVFLRLNRYRLTADRVAATRTILAVASGDLQVDELARWIRSNVVPA